MRAAVRGGGGVLTGLPDPLAPGLRDRFLLDPAVAFLNHGSFGATPRRVLASQAAWRERLERDPVAFLARDWPALLRQRADDLAPLLGARGVDLAWVDNATTGVAAVLSSFDWRPGDEIVTTRHVYGAVRQAVTAVCDRYGTRRIEAPLGLPLANAAEIVACVEAALTPAARLLIVDHVASFSGVVFPVTELISVARARGVAVLVDGAHAPGQVPVDLGALSPDWYVANAHKWLFAPKGCAVLWTHPDRQASTHPAVLSHLYGSGYLAEFDWTGTRDPTPWLALDAAIGFVAELGLERLMSYNRALADRAGTWLAEQWGTSLPVPADLRAALCTLEVPVAGHVDAARALALHRALYERFGVQVPTWAHDDRLWLRLSAQVHLRASDVERLGDALPAALRGL